MYTLSTSTQAGNASSSQAKKPTARRSTSPTAKPVTTSHLVASLVRIRIVDVAIVNTAAMRIA
jgi:hypothetical protein